jgi:hypothetical protein
MEGKMRIVEASVVISLIATLAGQDIASADTIATCSGNSQGKAYYVHGGIVPKLKSGFVDDGTTGNKISLTLNEQQEWDILWVDARQEIYSAKDSGGAVAFIGMGSTGFSISAVYDTAEGLVTSVYSISLNGSDQWELGLMQTKQTDVITKVGFEMLKCQSVDLDGMAKLYGID